MLFLIALTPFAALGPESLPFSRLSPAAIQPNLCVYRAKVGTSSPQCQAFCDQGAAYYFSYVYPEAVRGYETALRHDPDCAAAWLGLHNALEKWNKPAPPGEPLLALAGGLARAKTTKEIMLAKMKALAPRASHREQLRIAAKLQERSGETDARKKAAATLDELLTLYDDDEEAWYARAQLADGANGPIPFYKALLKVNPLHPGANHELVHYFETAKRPALGWPYAENYMKSSPGIPHAFHMQAHLATRIGKWTDTADWSLKAAQLERDYHKSLGVAAKDDEQFSHHLETLTRSLLHDGRFAEAAKLRTEAERHKLFFRPEWMRLAIFRENWADAESLVKELRKTDKTAAAYWAALVALSQSDLKKAKAEADVLRQARGGKFREVRQWEVQGRLLCAEGDVDAGLKLIRRAVEKTKDDYVHHAWGNGASLMETWGELSMAAGKTDEAEEAFQEALAHDAGSVRGALGMMILCSHSKRDLEAARYEALARKCWSRAEKKDFDLLQSRMLKLTQSPPVATGGL